MKVADKFAWGYLIEHGTIYKDWSNYSANYIKDEGKTKKFKQRFKAVGVDWKKTKPCSDSSQYEFNGTFAEDSRVHTMEGTLVLNDGTKYNFGKANIDTRDLIEYLLEYVEYPDFMLEKL